MNSHVKSFLSGMVLGAFIILCIYPYIFPTKPEIIERVEYKTIHKVDTRTLTLEQALGCVQSPLIIDANIKDNWMIIKAQDKCKESRIDVRIKGSANSNWQTYATVGGLCLAGGVVATLYLLK